MRTISAGCVLAMAGLLTACGGSPPNTTVTGIVESAKRISQSNRLTGGSHHYELVLKADNAESWRPLVAGNDIEENEVGAAIGKRLTFTCHRPETASRTCYTHTFVVDGRDRMRPAR